MESDVTATEKVLMDQVIPEGSRQATGRRNQGVRPIFMIVLGVAAIGLLVEHLLVVNDLTSLREKAKVVALQLENPVSELAVAEPGDVPDPTAILALENQLAEKEREIQRLRAEGEEFEKELSRLQSQSLNNPMPRQPTAQESPRSNALSFGENSKLDDSVRGGRNAPNTSLHSRKGRCIARQEGSDVVAIDLGRRDGIQPDMELKLFAGEIEVGRIKILEVRESLSGGRVVMIGGRPLREDFEVRW